MIEIFPFKPDPSPATVTSKSISQLKVGRAVHIWIIGTEFLPKFGVVDSRDKSLFELHKTVKQGFGHVLTAKVAESCWKFFLRC